MSTPLVLQSLDAYERRAMSFTDEKICKAHMDAQKLLRAMLVHAPCLEGQELVAHSITLCVSNDDSLLQLSEHYFTGLIFPMRAMGGKTPVVSEHPSRISAEVQREINAGLIESAKRDQRALKALALRRDHFHCALTGKYDIPSCEHFANLIQDGREFAYTQAAHIIPFSINKTNTNTDIDNSAGVWEMIAMFTGISLDELNGDSINRLENIITLDIGMHESFGRLSIYLEPIEGQPNSYRFRKSRPWPTEIQDGTIITFTSADPALPLPDARYLVLHAACAKVAHASGAAEVINAYLQDMEDIKVLAQDGSSMRTLEHALSLACVTTY